MFSILRFFLSALPYSEVVSPYGEIWNFTRLRLEPALAGITERQLQWKPFPKAHSIGEYLLHIAGAECFWATRLGGLPTTERDELLVRCLMLDFLEVGVFPVPNESITVERALDDLRYGGERVRQLIEHPTQAQLDMPLISPMGDPIDGRQGLWRLAQHAAYHTGQIVLLQQMPDYPG
jgi:uncharacterized damage-inducible protein DinB